MNFIYKYLKYKQKYIQLKIIFKNKYLKYKQKYILLKKKIFNFKNKDEIILNNLISNIYNSHVKFIIFNIMLYIYNNNYDNFNNLLDNQLLINSNHIKDYYKNIFEKIIKKYNVNYDYFYNLLNNKMNQVIKIINKKTKSYKFKNKIKNHIKKYIKIKIPKNFYDKLLFVKLI